MAPALKSLVKRAALRTLASGRAPAWLRPQLRAMRRAIVARPGKPSGPR